MYMSVIYVDRERLIKPKEYFLPIVLGSALTALFFRLWYLQVVKSEELTQKAEAYHQTVLHRDAPRGLIVDRNNQLLAGVHSELIITAQPAIVKKHPDVVKKVAIMLDLPLKKLQRKLNDAYLNPYQPTPIYVGPSIALATKITESAYAYPGFAVESQPMRFYTETTALPHLMGYVWTPNEKDVNRYTEMDIYMPSYVGKAGIEYQYDRELVGKPGVESMEADVYRKPLKTLARDHAIHGDRLKLTVDKDLQRLATELLAGRKGAAVAIEPTTGEVLCLVSSPTYDNSKFLNGISRNDWKELLNNQDHPLINRSIYGTYPPASVNKILITMTAMRKGRFSPHEKILCRGYYPVGKKKVKCLGNHGMISFEHALAKSCNSYFAELGIRVGIDAIRETCEMAQLGKKTGIDLSGESKGVVPTEEWIKKWRKPAKWYPGDTVNIAIGQGEIHITPLQAAQIICLMANQGKAFRPHLLKSRYPAGNNHKNGVMTKPEVTTTINLSQAHWNILHNAMVKVVEEGTVAKGKINGLRWAAKTGSAEYGKHKELNEGRSHSWCGGYAPAENPKIALAVIVEASGLGGAVAAPIASKLVKQYLGINEN